MRSNNNTVPVCRGKYIFYNGKVNAKKYEFYFSPTQIPFVSKLEANEIFAGPKLGSGVPFKQRKLDFVPPAQLGFVL